MQVVIAILVLVAFIAIYIGFYLLNSKVKKPENCKELECKGCTLNCKWRE